MFFLVCGEFGERRGFIGEVGIWNMLVVRVVLFGYVGGIFSMCVGIIVLYKRNSEFSVGVCILKFKFCSTFLIINIYYDDL